MYLIITNGFALLDLPTNLLLKLQTSSYHFEGVLNAFEAVASKICCCAYH